MPAPLESIIRSGTKLWLDSVDPDLIEANRALGATGATSNPIIISDLIKTGRYDDVLGELLRDEALDDSGVAWQLTDQIVRSAQKTFLPVWESTGGNDGYVSFELDPLLEDPAASLSVEERTAAYIELGSEWSADHANRMIKTPATPAGLASLEELSARGVTLNVTLLFTMDQYRAARDAIWRGAQRRDSTRPLKSVYSIFISRIDVYTEQRVPELSAAAQGQVGIVNAKQIWRENQDYWAERATPLEQEIIFASTGAKLAGDPPWKYVEPLVGSGIQTNPPATNEAVAASGKTFEPTVADPPVPEVVAEINDKVDVKRLETTLMEEGVEKFAAPQRDLLALIADRRQQLVAAK